MHPKTCSIFGNKILQCFWCSGTGSPSDVANAKGEKNGRMDPAFEGRKHKGTCHWAGEERGKKQQNLCLFLRRAAQGVGRDSASLEAEPHNWGLQEKKPTVP